jgi:hypothetical protein
LRPNSPSNSVTTWEISTVLLLPIL